MRSTDHAASIRDFVEDVTLGDTVTVETKKGKYLNEQSVSGVHNVDGGKIVCITVGGDVPMMILETVSEDTYTHAYTYKDDSYQHIGRLREFGHEGHPKFDEYDAEGWLEVEEFIQAIQ